MKERIKGLFGKLKTKLNSLGRKKMLAIVLSLSIGLTAVLGIGVGVTYASYKRKHASDNALSAKSFYFESNLLKKDGATYKIYSDTISFNLTNFPDELRSSDVDITYNVTISSVDGGALPQDPNRTATLFAKESGVKTPASSTITYTGLELGKTYTVIAQATLPYTKTISATFEMVVGNYQVPYTLEDHGDYVVMNISTTDYLGNVNISWQNGYVPDNSAPILTNASGTSCTTSVTHNSSYTLKFFKTDSNVIYDATAFSLAVAN